MKFLVYIISVFVLFQIQLFSQTGSIKGKITDGKNPVPFVNVIFLNTNIGAGSEQDGTYRIDNIPAAEYEIKFSAIGYETKYFNVVISAGKL